MAYLVLVRHGISDWNVKGLWTGWTDIEMNEQGLEDIKKMAPHLTDIQFHSAHVSKLKRAQQTLNLLKEHLGIQDLPTKIHGALNERHYGIYTGLNKWEVKEKVGEEEFQKIRRSWDHPIPEGETMAAVHARVVPYFEQEILQELKDGKNVLVSAHGNSLRALVKHLEQLTDDQLKELEVGLGEVRVYEFDNDGKVVSSHIRGENPNKGKV